MAKTIEVPKPKWTIDPVALFEWMKTAPLDQVKAAPKLMRAGDVDAVNKMLKEAAGGAA